MSRVPITNKAEIYDCVFSLNATQTVPLNAFDVANATKKDLTLQKVIDFTLRGWPKIDNNSLELIHYYRRRNEITIENGCLLLGTKVIIPKVLQSEVLRLFHEEHVGIVRTKMLMRSYCWWPRINEDIEQFIGSCEICQTFQNSPNKVYFPWPSASNNFFRVYVDLIINFY